MSDMGHDLHNEFPDAQDILHEMKLDDARFRDLSLRHHQLSKEIGRIEAGIEAASDERLEDLKKRRLINLDEIARRIAETRKAAQD